MTTSQETFHVVTQKNVSMLTIRKAGAFFFFSGCYFSVYQPITQYKKIVFKANFFEVKQDCAKTERELLDLKTGEASLGFIIWYEQSI